MEYKTLVSALKEKRIYHNYNSVWGFWGDAIGWVLKVVIDFHVEIHQVGHTLNMQLKYDKP